MTLLGAISSVTSLLSLSPKNHASLRRLYINCFCTLKLFGDQIRPRPADWRGKSSKYVWITVNETDTDC